MHSSSHSGHRIPADSIVRTDQKQILYVHCYAIILYTSCSRRSKRYCWVSTSPQFLSTSSPRWVSSHSFSFIKAFTCQEKYKLIPSIMFHLRVSHWSSCMSFNTGNPAQIPTKGFTYMEFVCCSNVWVSFMCSIYHSKKHTGKLTGPSVCVSMSVTGNYPKLCWGRDGKEQSLQKIMIHLPFMKLYFSDTFLFFFLKSGLLSTITTACCLTCYTP